MNGLNIIYEDDYLLVLEKPAGLVVNKSETIKEETLQDELSDYFHSGPDLGIGDRAGIVHRLDRETSGLMVVAKTKAVFENLQSQFKERKIQKEYVVLVHGKISDDMGEIDAAIGRVGSFGKFGIVSGGRESKTVFAVETRLKIKDETFNNLTGDENKNKKKYLSNHAREYTYVTLFPKTGRTHQIRVHLKSIGHPLVSDLIYTPSKLLKFDILWCERLFLHAKSIEFVHPKTNKPIFFASDLPKDLKEALEHLTINY